jgi:hypothetical protein
MMLSDVILLMGEGGLEEEELVGEEDGDCFPWCNPPEKS